MNTASLDDDGLSTGYASRFEWLRICTCAVIHPSVPYYERLATSPLATPGRGYRWITISTAFNLFFVTLRSTPFGPAFFPILFRNTMIWPFFILIITVILLWITDWLARKQGGIGNLETYIFVYAAFSAPLTIIYPVFFWFTLIRWVYIAYLIYWLLLGVIAIKAVHYISWENAMVSQALLLITMISGVVEQIGQMGG